MRTRVYLELESQIVLDKSIYRAALSEGSMQRFGIVKYNAVY